MAAGRPARGSRVVSEGAGRAEAPGEGAAGQAPSRGGGPSLGRGGGGGAPWARARRPETPRRRLRPPGPSFVPPFTPGSQADRGGGVGAGGSGDARGILKWQRRSHLAGPGAARWAGVGAPVRASGPPVRVRFTCRGAACAARAPGAVLAGNFLPGGGQPCSLAPDSQGEGLARKKKQKKQETSVRQGCVCVSV